MSDISAKSNPKKPEKNSSPQQAQKFSAAMAAAQHAAKTFPTNNHFFQIVVHDDVPRLEKNAPDPNSQSNESSEPTQDRKTPLRWTPERNVALLKEASPLSTHTHTHTLTPCFTWFII
jgi:hypothetical protein